MSLNNWGIAFKNDSGEVIPPFAVMRVTGVEAIGERLYPKLAKPNTFGSYNSHYLNGPTEVGIGMYGSCTGIFPALGIAGGSPLAGESVGPRSGSWELEVDTGGFITLGSSGSNLIVDRNPMNVFYGKFTGSVSMGSTGTVTVYWEGASTSQTVSTVYAVSGSFAGSDWVNVYRLGDRWEAYRREC